ncbi:hypothetical protein [Janibacter sp. GXQ6167]|uniref:HalD/BesD family halogenase n=1 Tax=Janibacter sp. GXQ6167 TaxID=3240791 RepID=UPI0035234F0E
MTSSAHSAPATAAGYADVVDLETYPIDDLDGPEGRALVESCRSQLEETGVCTLPGFVRDEAITEMIRIAEDLIPRAWRSDQRHTIYFEPVDAEVDPGHPRAHTVRSAKDGIAYDLIPADAPVRRMYESDDLTRFIAAVLGKTVLYRSADPLDAMQITAFHEGQELGWHFDNSEFSMTLMYQQPEAGGEFVYVPRLRSAEEENYEGVRRVLHEEDTASLRTLPSAPGTLAFFRGQHALHRVTEVQGETPRLNTVLTYGERPDMRLRDLTSELFYGRRSPAPDAR